MRVLNIDNPTKNSNLFVSLQYLTHSLEVRAALDSIDFTFISSSFDIDLLKDLMLSFDTFLDSSSYKFKDNSIRSRRAIVKITYLLPKSFGNRVINSKKLNAYLLSTIKELTNSDEELHHVSFLQKKGSATYLVHYILNVSYDAKGSKKCIIAGSDRFKCSISGKLCKKDHPTAVLFKKKGDILRESSSVFGKRLMSFSFHSTKLFKYFIAKLKSFLFEFFDRIVELKRGFSFKRHKAEIYLKNVTNCRIIRNIMIKMEHDIEKRIDCLKLGYFSELEIENELIKTVRKYVMALKRGSFNKKLNQKRKLKLSIDYSTNTSVLIDNLNTFYDEFKNELDLMLSGL